jgi:hypothetical protein
MGSDKVENEKEYPIFERYKLLIQARNFHYDNFSKWMTYFYVAIGAVFVGYCTIISSDKEVLEELILLLPILGFIISLMWYWSAKGYYYWNINFINLVNHYEKDLLKFEENERVYFVFANKELENNYGSPISGANVSTSKVAILFAFIVTLFWGIILYLNILEKCKCIGCENVLLAVFLSITTIYLLSVLIPSSKLKSNHEHFPDLGITLKDLGSRNNNK